MTEHWKQHVFLNKKHTCCRAKVLKRIGRIFTHSSKMFSVVSLERCAVANNMLQKNQRLNTRQPHCFQFALGIVAFKGQKGNHVTKLVAHFIQFLLPGSLNAGRTGGVRQTWFLDFFQNLSQGICWDESTTSQSSQARHGSRVGENLCPCQHPTKNAPWDNIPHHHGSPGFSPASNWCCLYLSLKQTETFDCKLWFC